MTAALTLVLLTATAGDPGDLVTQAVTKATREVLGAETQFIVRSFQQLPSDAEASALAKESSADVVVELTWNAPDNLRAHVRLLRASSGRWVDRTIGFERADREVERGRTVGFAVASMLPERASSLEDANDPTPEARPVVAPAPVTSTAREIPRHVAAEADEEPRFARAAIDAVFAAGFGAGDQANGIGGGVDFRLALGPHVFARVAGAGRVGDVPPVQATLRSLSAAAGMSLETSPFQARSFTLGVRADVLALREDLTRLSATAASVRQGRWLAGADLLVETAWFFAPNVGIFAAAGGEAAFGTLTIFVQGHKVDTLQPLRPVAELGLRTQF